MKLSYSLFDSKMIENFDENEFFEMIKNKKNILIHIQTENDNFGICLSSEIYEKNIYIYDDFCFFYYFKFGQNIIPSKYDLRCERSEFAFKFFKNDNNERYQRHRNGRERKNIFCCGERDIYVSYDSNQKKFYCNVEINSFKMDRSYKRHEFNNFEIKRLIIFKLFEEE